MLKLLLLFLILRCSYAFASLPENAKQQKRGVIDNDGWIGLPNPYGFGCGDPWTVDHTPWEGLKPFDLNLHMGLHVAGAVPYDNSRIALTADVPKTLPVYITKHVVLEKPVPVPEPVMLEKPYQVPVEKVIPVPIEKIIHKPVPIPIPVSQAVPIPVEHPIPIPMKQPIAVPVQQPYPVLLRYLVSVPWPVPVPFSLHPPAAIPLSAANGLGGAIYPHVHEPGALNHVYPPVHLGHGIAALDHGFGHGFGHGFDHALAHGYRHNYRYVHADDPDHEHEHKKRKSDKN